MKFRLRRKGKVWLKCFPELEKLSIGAKPFDPETIYEIEVKGIKQAIRLIVLLFISKFKR